MTLPLFESYREIPLTKGQVTLVDVADYDWLSTRKWQAHRDTSTGKFYACRNGSSQGKSVFIAMHREILGLIGGDGMIADHISGDTLDNRRSNLRVVSKHQNNLNTKVRQDNASGYKGVTRRGQRWIAQINHGGKRVHLGMADTPEGAYALYCEAAKEHHGEFARLA